MQVQELDLQIVTPLFLGGANPNGPPELRSPAFRGELRYWLRAAIGAVVGDADIQGLRTLEQAVFGSTELASAIAVRISQVHLQSETAYILPHHEQGRRTAFKPGQTFSLVINAPRPVTTEVWRTACAISRVMLTFGGVGLRARRGYGTLTIPKGFPVTCDGWEKHVQNTLAEAVNAVRALAARHGIPVLPAPPPAACHYPCGNQAGMIRIVCDPIYPTAQKAVIAFMNRAIQAPYLGGIQPRQASPLWVRPIAIEGGFGLLFMVLASTFAGSDYAQVRTFIDKFSGRDVGVKGWNQP